MDQWQRTLKLANITTHADTVGLTEPGNILQVISSQFSALTCPASYVARLYSCSWLPLVGS